MDKLKIQKMDGHLTMRYFRNNFETNIDQGDNFENCHSSPRFNFWISFFKLLLIFFIQQIFLCLFYKDFPSCLVSQGKFRMITHKYLVLLILKISEPNWFWSYLIRNFSCLSKHTRNSQEIGSHILCGVQFCLV